MLKKNDKNFFHSWGKIILDFRIIVILVFMLLFIAGLSFSPFDWEISWLPSNPIAVDALPDISDNQQIVFTAWPGHSPREIEDQITYPLTVSLMGLPGVKTVRSNSMFGFSSIYIIFEDGIDFYWSRSRILEKIASINASLLPKDAKPKLGPDATSMGQVFWYTLEGRTPEGKAAGGWDLEELRTIQDWTVRYSLLGSAGVSEVASVGGFVKEYQINLDPEAMRYFDVSLKQVYEAVMKANSEVGARTIELNKVEYVLRGIGYVEELEDYENSVVTVKDNVPIYLKDIAHICLGPALRRGILDKNGTEAVGAAVVVRNGANPLQAIKNVKKKIAKIAPALPEKKLADGTVSKVTIVPFYDRTKLINETLGTLRSVLLQEIAITIIVILIMIRDLRSATIISTILPCSVLLCFVLMKISGIEANIVALAGIAIAIGTVVDMGIVICENAVEKSRDHQVRKNPLAIVRESVSEVGAPLITSVASTVISFIPVFFLENAEGRLFRPLAWTKTFMLICAAITALALLPVILSILLPDNSKKVISKSLFRLVISNTALITAGILVWTLYGWMPGILIITATIVKTVRRTAASEKLNKWLSGIWFTGAVLYVMSLLSEWWLPAGPDAGIIRNYLTVLIPVMLLLGIFTLFEKNYTAILKWCISNKIKFCTLPVLAVIIGISSWLGIPKLTSFLPTNWRETSAIKFMDKVFPGMQSEFMPALDEGTFMIMPSAMPHVSVEEITNILKNQDMALNAIPEVTSAVGKAGRIDSALDPAPLSMIETVVNCKDKFLTDKDGTVLKFKYEPEKTDYFQDKEGKKINAPDGEPYKVKGYYPRDKSGKLIPDSDGFPFLQWRPPLETELNPGRQQWKGIIKRDDIWKEISEASKFPGVTASPRLQPIETRLVMLQTGMKGQFGLKISGPDLNSLAKAAAELEKNLKQAPSIIPETVFAEKVTGKPYLEISVDRKAAARYGIKLASLHEMIDNAIGGKQIDTIINDRERFPVRLRYQRELRDNPEALERLPVTAPDGTEIPLGQLADVSYRRGPQNIRGENGFLSSYVFFDCRENYSEVSAIESAASFLAGQKAEGKLALPPKVNYEFAGNFLNQRRAAKRMSILIPAAMLLIFIIIYMQFKNTFDSLMIFSSVAVAWAGGFILLWLYGQDWFFNWNVFGISLRETLNIHQVNLSVAVWVGFLALFGIASDDGVIMGTYLRETHNKLSPDSIDKLRKAVIEAGKRRVRPCLMTTATTILALLPVLTASGRGSDLMLPMAIPVVGGMIIEVITMLIIPVIFCWKEEILLKHGKNKA
jgi:Cu(I)/Ag(I) efflux system membrane protein CusA/SilA